MGSRCKLSFCSFLEFLYERFRHTPDTVLSEFFQWKGDIQYIPHSLLTCTFKEGPTHTPNMNTFTCKTHTGHREDRADNAWMQSKHAHTQILTLTDTLVHACNAEKETPSAGGGYLSLLMVETWLEERSVRKSVFVKFIYIYIYIYEFNIWRVIQRRFQNIEIYIVYRDIS